MTVADTFRAVLSRTEGIFLVQSRLLQANA